MSSGEGNFPAIHFLDLPRGTDSRGSIELRQAAASAAQFNRRKKLSPDILCRGLGERPDDLDVSGVVGPLGELLTGTVRNSGWAESLCERVAPPLS
jgi:hypothetical protein